ncbi:hypothetical protein [Planctomicrobium piriforme]|uniref:Uncharacterized protein n=1 Tax=Planctomicrobium piriforme TaxID=1576369 RepID=A0A1I3MU66_9PLAN|nr:hypothetical protein [Planctomicrobium piriforme]SFJ00527.1 hypothetical protein SAMN05421753_114111 [Planctomicrobium piriforme]
MQNKSKASGWPTLFLALIFVAPTIDAWLKLINGNGDWWPCFLGGSNVLIFGGLAIRDFRRKWRESTQQPSIESTDVPPVKHSIR